MASGPPGSKVLTEDNVFTNLRKMEYAVRGPLLLRALEIEKELQKVRNHGHHHHRHIYMYVRSDKYDKR